MIKNIAIFASGSGSNAENIYHYFKNRESIKISSILTNNCGAKVIERASRLGIDCKIFNREAFYHSSEIVDYLIFKKIDLVILAGFLWIIPTNLIHAFPNKIINIHPALLPKYGGKGMYGDKVHQSVIENCDAESGITIHYVNEKYDEGEIIFQAKCAINKNDNAVDLASKIHALEYEHFPKVIEKLLA